MALRQRRCSARQKRNTALRRFPHMAHSPRAARCAAHYAQHRAAALLLARCAPTARAAAPPLRACAHAALRGWRSQLRKAAGDHLPAWRHHSACLTLAPAQALCRRRDVRAAPAANAPFQALRPLPR